MKQPPEFVAQEGIWIGMQATPFIIWSEAIPSTPRALFDWFSSMVQEFCMNRSTTDHSVFNHHTSSGQCIYLIVYVDDIVIMNDDQDGIQRLKQHLFSHF